MVGMILPEEMDLGTKIFIFLNLDGIDGVKDKQIVSDGLHDSGRISFFYKPKSNLGEKEGLYEIEAMCKEDHEKPGNYDYEVHVVVHNNTYNFSPTIKTHLDQLLLE